MRPQHGLLGGAVGLLAALLVAGPGVRGWRGRGAA